MNFAFISVILLTLTVSGCGKNKGSGGKGDESKTATASGSTDSNGNCDSSFVSDYNSVVFETKMANNALKSSLSSDSERRTRLQSVINACSKFFAHHSSVTCNAEVNYKENKISSSDLSSGCDQASDILSKL